ncbi:hypothetical protein D9M68_891920 [compost metagenome]
MNWGTKIILGMIAFMLFIIAMVAYMFSVHDNDALVAEDYYEKGINYDQDYNALQNTIKDQAEPIFKFSENQLIIQLKDTANYELKLLRPAAAKDDVKQKGSTVGDTNLILVDRHGMPKGLWLLELKWTSKGKDYLFKKSITL